MKHISEDKLLEYALEIITGDSEKEEIESHLGGCNECREHLQAIQKDIEILSSMRAPETILPRPAIKSKRMTARAAVRAAALLLIGFLAGFSVSNMVHREPASILPSYIKLSPPADSLLKIVVSDATQIGQGYYEQILELQSGN